MFKKCMGILIAVAIVLTGCNNAKISNNSVVKDSKNNIAEEKNEENKNLEKKLELILPKHSAKDLIADIEFLIKTIEEVHPNSYAYIDKDKFYDELNNVKSQIDKPMNNLEFYKIIAPLVSLLKDGHTNVFIPNELFDKYLLVSEARVFPLIIEVRENKIFNKKGMNEEIDIPIGAEIIAINDIKTEEILKKLKKYETGMRDAYKEVKLERDFYFLLWLEYGFLDEYKIIYKNNGISNTQYTKGTLKYNANKYYKNRFNGNMNYSYKILEDKICYLDFNSFSDYNSFNRLLEKMFKEIKEKNIEELIIDIRDNGGGNSSLGDLLISYIYNKPFYQFKRIDLKVSKPIIKKYKMNEDFKIGEIITYDPSITFISDVANRFNGKVCILTNRYTFSSATAFATIIKDFNIGILIGEETGGLGGHYGDVYRFRLPNSMLMCGVSHKYFVRPSGDETPRGVIPHHEVIQTSEDTSRNIDTALEFGKRCILEEYDKDYNRLKSSVDIDYVETSTEDEKYLKNIIEHMFNSFFDNDYNGIYEIISEEMREIFTKEMIDKSNSELLHKFGQLNEVFISQVSALQINNKISEYYVEGKIVCGKGDMYYKVIFDDEKKIKSVNTN